MRQNLCCLLFLVVCLAAVLVKSQKFTEIDENGNEIEVKRFYIEGRQLNDGNRQCVETRRRKRSSNYGKANKNDEMPIASFTAPTGIDTSDGDDDGSADEPIAVFGVFNSSGKKKQQSLVAANGAEDEDDESEEQAVFNLPVVAQLSHGNGAQSTVGAASAGDNGVVIVQANKPPKVNSQTHGFFELRPIQSENSGGDGFEDEGDDYGDLAYEEEVNPVSTTAIWSTGEDNPEQYSQIGADYEDNSDKDVSEESYDEQPIDTAPIKSRPRPTQKPSRKTSKKTNKKSSSKRRNKSKSKRRQSGNKKPTQRRKQNSSFHHKTANRNKNQNLINRDIKNNQLNRLHNVNKGSNSFTKTETFTQTGTPNDQKDINCIIINRTTTARPFWALFGRNADGGEVPEDKPYGRRKRINFSIPA